MTVDLRIYASAFVLTMLGLYLASLGLAWFAVALPNGVATVAPPMVAALLTGHRLGKSYKRPFTKHEGWKVAIPLTLCGMAISLVLMLVYMLLVSGDQAMAILSLLGPFGWVMAFAITGILMGIINRLFVGLGLRQQLRSYSKE
jgi:RsiW-degrading membrane proteinase PrsW (M82 family)